MSKRSKAHYSPLSIVNSESAPFPGDGNGFSSTRHHWERERMPGDQRANSVRGSPTLAQLQSRSEDGKPGGFVHAAQRELEKKHHRAKSRVHAGVSGIGGGVSLWPAMDDMRLSGSEVNWLVVVCGVLIVGTMSVFLACHGE